MKQYFQAMLVSMMSISGADLTSKVYAEDYREISGGEGCIVSAVLRDESIRGGEHLLLFAIWDDGAVVWSRNQITGGAPYFESTVSLEKIEAMTKSFRLQGVFHELPFRTNFSGIDVPHTVVSIRHGENVISLSSCHEYAERDGGLVASSAGLHLPKADGRLHQLLGDSKDYLLFRLAWSEIRLSVQHVLPDRGNPINGRVQFSRDAKIFWISKMTLAK